MNCTHDCTKHTNLGPMVDCLCAHCDRVGRKHKGGPPPDDWVWVHGYQANTMACSKECLAALMTQYRTLTPGMYVDLYRSRKDSAEYPIECESGTCRVLKAFVVYERVDKSRDYKTGRGPKPGPIIAMVQAVWTNGNESECDLSDMANDMRNYFETEWVEKFKDAILDGHIVHLRVNDGSPISRIEPLWGRNNVSEAKAALQRFASTISA